jgi:hypothetical protein
VKLERFGIYIESDFCAANAPFFGLDVEIIRAYRDTDEVCG